MSLGVARRERLFPLWLGGPLASELAYRIFLLAFPHGFPPCDVERVHLEPADEVTNVELVERVGELLEAEQADVLRALAELKALGIFATKRKGSK